MIRDKEYLRYKYLLLENESLRKEFKSIGVSATCETKKNRCVEILFECAQIQHDLISQAKKKWQHINWYKFTGASIKVINLETD